MADLPVGQVICGDALEVMAGFGDGEFSAVVTDPPYGVGIAEWDVAPTAAFRDECLRVATGPVVMFGGAQVRSQREFVALEPDRMLVWQITMTLKQNSTNGIYHRWQPIWCWRLPDKTGGPWCDVLPYATPGHCWWEHPCTKPLPLMRDLVQLDLTGGDVLDPFCGSGTTLVACVQTGRRFVGIDISEDYCAIARRRVAEALAQPMLDFGAPQAKPRQEGFEL